MLTLQQRMSTNEAHALSEALTDLVEAEAHLFFTLWRTGAAEPGPAAEGNFSPRYIATHVWSTLQNACARCWLTGFTRSPDRGRRGAEGSRARGRSARAGIGGKGGGALRADGSSALRLRGRPRHLGNLELPQRDRPSPVTANGTWSGLPWVLQWLKYRSLARNLQ